MGPKHSDSTPKAKGSGWIDIIVGTIGVVIVMPSSERGTGLHDRQTYKSIA